ncbi:MAG: carboxypeptidase-like regulatory domain-containing protein, partial [Gemmatimonadota bacterium]|nr:carboxypeptidase-like regulatory domain-containing protein [Gemmatimonadota bacterium]
MRVLRRLSLLSVGLLGVLLLPSGVVAAQQAATVTGRVMSEGNPVPSATVSIPELGLGALTNEAGRYSIT